MRRSAFSKTCALFSRREKGIRPSPVFGRSLILAMAAMLCLTQAKFAWAAGNVASKPGLDNPFFAFDNGVGAGRVPPQEQAETLKRLGYAGIGFTGAQGIPEMLQALDARGLKMFSIYLAVNLAPEPGKPPYDPLLKSAIRRLKGRGTQIWLPLLGGKPSSTGLDDRAVALVREIAELAEKSKLCVALYPHQGMYVQRVEDAVRLTEKIRRKNVGICFNLCHFLKIDDEKNLEQRLKEAKPYLLAVNINGADGGNTHRMDWNRLIQTLDRGSFDVGRLLKTLAKLGYAQPVGLQCYGIPGDWRENLKRSMKAWQDLRARSAPERREDAGINPNIGQSRLPRQCR
jgi:sugar phosphate isomerase/epimerase